MGRYFCSEQFPACQALLYFVTSSLASPIKNEMPMLTSLAGLLDCTLVQTADSLFCCFVVFLLLLLIKTLMNVRRAPTSVTLPPRIATIQREAIGATASPDCLASTRLCARTSTNVRPARINADITRNASIQWDRISVSVTQALCLCKGAGTVTTWTSVGPGLIRAPATLCV